MGRAVRNEAQSNLLHNARATLSTWIFRGTGLDETRISCPALRQADRTSFYYYYYS
jgi:hypothetical protein